MTSTHALHLAAQYLAAAGKSFLPPQSDDSHTNLGWAADTQSLVSQPLNGAGDVLALNVANYSLDFVNPSQGLVSSYALQGARHLDLVNWIERERQVLNMGQAYVYKLHYELPYEKMTDAFTFPLVGQEELEGHSALRTLADLALKYSTVHFHHFSHIRVWPHRFDTGALGFVDNREHVNSLVDTIGLGLAIPDGLVDDYYFYVSGWNGDTQPDLSAVAPLRQGRWYNKGWKGAVLPASGRSIMEVNAFLRQSIGALTSLVP